MSNATPLLICLSSLLVLSCSSHEKVSDPTYAHYKAEYLIGSPLGRLELLNRSAQVDFDAVRICIQSAPDLIEKNNHILEVKVAYATWFAAIEDFGERDWEKFSFEYNDECHTADKSYGSVVKFADHKRPNLGENFKSFQEITVQCQKYGLQSSCSSGSTTRGYGGPGSLAMYNRGGKWVRLMSASPSRAVLSDKVNWISLPEDISRNTSVSVSVKNELIDEYNRLSIAGNQSFSNLSAFVKKIEEAELLTAEDQSFQKIMNDFSRSNQQHITTILNPEIGQMHVLIHEVGHQLGLAHADNPSYDCVTGKSGVTSLNSNEQWVTDESTMAYALNYIYLTGDDKAGINAAYKTIVESIDKKL